MLSHLGSRREWAVRQKPLDALFWVKKYTIREVTLSKRMQPHKLQQKGHGVRATGKTRAGEACYRHWADRFCFTNSNDVLPRQVSRGKCWARTDPASHSFHSSSAEIFELGPFKKLWACFYVTSHTEGPFHFISSCILHCTSGCLLCKSY